MGFCPLDKQTQLIPFDCSLLTIEKMMVPLGGKRQTTARQAECACKLPESEFSRWYDFQNCD